MNTLNMSYKHSTENPFEHPMKYPALQYKGLTILPSPSNSDANMESVNSDDSHSQSDGSQEDGNRQDKDAQILIDTDDIID